MAKVEQLISCPACTDEEGFPVRQHCEKCGGWGSKIINVEVPTPDLALKVPVE